MEPELVDLGQMVIVGIAENGPDIGPLWDRFTAAEGQIRNKVEGVWYELHVHPDCEHEWSDVTVMVSAEVTKPEGVPKGMSVKRLRASRYAVFTHRLADGGYAGANERINSWLESGPYRLSPNISIQRYDDRFKRGTSPDSEIDFLLPVVPKE